jgi:hypothetical protein
MTMPAAVEELARGIPQDMWLNMPPRGISYITEVQIGGTGVVTKLSHPAGYAIVEFDCHPTSGDRELPAGFTRMLAVNIRSRGNGLECTALGTSPSGPRRAGITLAQALALASAGVHTIYRTD